MRPFEFRQATAAWPPGTTLLHVYVTVDPDRDPELIRLVEAGQTAVAEFPISAVSRNWLHLTIDQVTDRPAAEIAQHERHALVTMLQLRMSRLTPFTVQIGSMLSYHSGVIADVSPDDEMTTLYEAVHASIRAVRGEAAARYPFQPAHLTIGYADAEADSDEVQRRLRRVRPSHAPLYIDSIHLVDVTATAGAARQITWDHVATIRLGTGSATVRSTREHRRRSPTLYPADVLHPAGADELVAAVDLAGMAGLAVIGVALGMSLSRISRTGEVRFAETWRDEDSLALAVLGQVAARNRLLRVVGQDDPINRAAVLEANQSELDDLRARVHSPWSQLSARAEQIIEQRWDQVTRITQRLADDAGVHGPINPDADPAPERT